MTLFRATSSSPQAMNQSMGDIMTTMSNDPHPRGRGSRAAEQQQKAAAGPSWPSPPPRTPGSGGKSEENHQQRWSPCAGASQMARSVRTAPSGYSSATCDPSGEYRRPG